MASPYSNTQSLGHTSILYKQFTDLHQMSKVWCVITAKDLIYYIITLIVTSLRKLIQCQKSLNCTLKKYFHTKSDCFSYHRLCLVTNLGLLRIYSTDSLQKLEFVFRYQTNKKLKIESVFNFDEGTICGCQVSLHHVFITENQYLS